MVRPYSLDLRERVVRTVLSGQSCRAVADIFGVSVASVVKWSQRHRATGTAAAKPMGSRRPFILEAERAWLLARLQEEPEVTTRALARELAVRGIVVSHVAVWNILRRERQTFKQPSSRVSRIALMSRAAAPGGNAIRRRSIQPASSSLTKPGRRRTWRPSEAGRRAASASRPRCRIIGGR